jgi:hypothetical protein
VVSSEDEKYSEEMPTPHDNSQTGHNRSSVLAAETPRSQENKDSIVEPEQDEYGQNEDNYSEDQPVESEKKYSSVPD